MPDSTFFLSPDFPLWTFGFLVVSMVGAIIGQTIGQPRTESLEESGQGATMGAAVKLFFAALVFGALGISFFSLLSSALSNMPSPWSFGARVTPEPIPSSPFSHVPTPPLPPGNWKRVQLLPRETSSDIATHGRRVEFLGPEGYNFIVLFVDTAGDSCMSWECKPGHYPRFRVLNIAKNWKKNPQKDHNEFIENVVWYRLL